MNDRPPSSRTSARAHDPHLALRQVNFRYFLCGNALSTVGMQMLTLAVSWELYDTTHSKTVLGLVSLLQFLPFLLLAIPAGHLADLCSRKMIILIDQLLLTISATALGLTTLFQNQIPDWSILHAGNAGLAALAGLFSETQCDFTNRYVPIMLALLMVNAIIRTVNQPAKQALLPQLVPPAMLPNAIMWNAGVFESSAMVGPLVAGALVALLQLNESTRTWSYAGVYFVTAVCQLGQWLFFLPILPLPTTRQREPVTLRSLHAGLRFVWRTEIILSAITLDLFGVLFGGATALLPVFAKDILGCGIVGLGFLRAAPSVGAIVVAVLLAYLPPIQRTGRALLITVAGFGVATAVFGLSKNFYLSLGCLFLVGFCDNTSVIIRNTLVQMLTPDSMRGRVTAVKSIFSNSSNRLGEMESCLAALLFGPVISVVSGGLGTLIVVVAVASYWPQTRKFGSLHDCQPLAEPKEIARSVA